MPTHLNIRVNTDWKAILEKLAEREGLDRSTAVRTAVQRWWEEPEPALAPDMNVVNTLSTQLSEKDKQLTEKDKQIAELLASAQQQNIIIAQMTLNAERQQLMLESTQTKLERQREPWYRRMFARSQVPTPVEE